MLRIGWFSTGKGEAARDLLKTAAAVPGVKIEFVFCNRERGESKETDLFLDLVKAYNLPVITLSSRNFKPDFRKSNLEQWREDYDKAVIGLLGSRIKKADVCFLAGYMLVCSSLMCEKFNIINLHPAKPSGPKGTWQEVIHKLIAEKERESGVMIHLVTPQLDEGPAITFCAFPLWIPYGSEDLWRLWDLFHDELIKEELFKWIRAEGLKREFPLITETLRLLAEGKIGTKNKKPLDLTEIINEKIRTC